MEKEVLISIIVPIYNESTNIPSFFAALSRILVDIPSYFWEIIFVDDGSRDNSVLELKKIKLDNVESRIKVTVLEFSRNFGKEAALSAGLSSATGDAALMIDADFQHPMELIPEFIAKWEKGAEVVIGIRRANKKASMLKRAGSFVFYGILKHISKIEMKPNETDFRLLDRQVITAFKRLPERNRMTRALIDWLGFKRDYLDFVANERADGKAGYNIRKLVNLALNSFICLSLTPLRLAGYLGVFIIMTSGPFGLYIILGKYIFSWPYASSFSGPAQLAFLITFLVGIILASLGLVALYIANIHNEVLGRPLYIVRRDRE